MTQILPHLSPKYSRRLWHPSGPRVEHINTSPLPRRTIIIESFHSLWSTGHPWRAPKLCDLQLSPWPHSTIFLYFLIYPLSFATFSSAYLFFYIHEHSNLMRCTISLKSASYVWRQFDTSSSRGSAYCFPLSQDYWGSWRHSWLLEPKPNWAGSPTGIFIPLCLFDVNVIHCLREVLRNTEFIPAKLIFSIASDRCNRIFYSPSVLVEKIPYARCR